jgi:hypothetical protein
MADIKLRDVNRAATLLKQVVGRADLNQDGAIRSGDLDKLTAHGMSGDSVQIVSGIRGPLGRATANGDRSITSIKAAVDELKARARAADTDGDGTLSVAEQKKLKTTGDLRFLGFVAWSKGTTLSDLDFPAKYTPPKPTFKWSGTPAEVCTSLLRAESKSSNDNHWPDWANLDGPSRYVIDGGEAKAMVKALGQLYINRQKAVLTELASRTQMFNPGCVSPTNAGKAVLEAYAAKLGLSLDFQQPSAPSMPSP